MRTHIRILALLQIVYASIGLLAGVVLLFIFGGAATIVSLTAQPSDSIVAIPILAAVGTLTAGFMFVLSLPRLVAGIGLLYHKNWARILTIVISAIGLLDFPVGTALGAYGLWVVTSRDSSSLFENPDARQPA
jgi:hypothetical protein